MKKLKDLLYRVALNQVVGSTDLDIREVTFDTRKVAEGDLFVALTGTLTDGHQYIEQALQAGAVAVLCERLPENPAAGICWCQVNDTKLALALIADNFFDHPSQHLQLVGVTGTNGKTTIASLLYQMFNKAGYACGLLSTVRICVDQTEYPATHTTPDSWTINRYLRQMVDAGVSYCFMEVSSHGIHQHRTAGLQFAGGIFTNLSHDHLDYHHTFAEYRDVKKAFFDQLSPEAFALTNIDDKNGPIMLQNTRARKMSYALKSLADFKGQILESQMGGLLLLVNQREVWVRLIGTFNAYNALAIYGTAVSLGMEPEEALTHLSTLESVAGRFQYFISPEKVTAVVDYAHTPDALENVLQTLGDIREAGQRIITVVGCGGDRDTTKRPIMAQAACQGSDQVILTSDNPRTENPETILDQMEQGLDPVAKRKVLRISDRAQAIKAACQWAQPNDIILVAGKGHETYQEIQGVKYPFDDLQTLRQFLLNA